MYGQFSFEDKVDLLFCILDLDLSGKVDLEEFLLLVIFILLAKSGLVGFDKKN